LDNPTSTIDLRLRVINSQHEDLFVKIKPEGFLADYVDLEKTTYHIKPNEGDRTINYKLSIPENLPPGQNVLTMYVLQVEEFSDNQIVSNNLQAKVSVVQRVNVNIPYPGQYLSGNLFVQSARVKEPIKFIVHVINKGDEDVSYSGKITIRGPTNQILGVIKIPSSTINSASDKKINLQLAGLTNPGEYVAEAHLQYGSEQALFRKSFSVGSKQIDAYEMKIERFRMGEIVKVVMGLSSQWNQPINDVYVEGKVIDSNGLVVSTFKSDYIDVPSQGLVELESFWDTKDIAPGVYDFDLQLHYGNQITENYFEAGLSLDKAVFKQKGMTGNVISQPEKNKNVDGGSTNQTLQLLVFLVIILVLVNIIWIMRSRKKKEK
jgi:hypothetical protein